MASASASPFKGIKESRQMGGGRRLEPGNYLLEIETVRFFQSRKDNRTNIFAVDLKVIESDNENFKPNDRVGWVTQESKFPEYFLADVKSFLAAAGDVDPDDIDDEDADTAVSADQPLRGDKIRCHVSPGKKKEGKDEVFHVHRFSPA